jgi:iron complex outermembrane receptor protein
MSKFNSVYASASRAALALALLSLSNPAYAQSDETDEIIVTGARLLGGSIDDAITGVSVLSGDALADRLAPPIGETLQSEPGVSSTFFGAGASRPIIRGQGGDRVRVLTNGIGSIDASSASPDHAVAAEPAQAELVEVLRGASLLRFGSSGAGGIVNIVDGRIPSEVPEDMDVALRIGASSADLGREVAGSVDKRLTDNLVLHRRVKCQPLSINEHQNIFQSSSCRGNFFASVKRLITLQRATYFYRWVTMGVDT